MDTLFDPEVMVGGVQLLLLVFGLVEFAKANLKISGPAVTVLAAVMGAVVMTLFQLKDVIPDPYGLYYDLAVKSLAFGLSASGYYKFSKKIAEPK